MMTRNERQRVAAPPDPRVEQHLHPVPDGVGDARQDLEGRGSVIQLAAAVVGDDDGVHSLVSGPARVRFAHDPLEGDGAVPLLARAAEPPYVLNNLNQSSEDGYV